MQRIISSDKSMQLMQYNSDGTGRRLFALTDHGDYVDMRAATTRGSYSEMQMDADVARAAYEWLGRWLAAQGAIVRR